MMTKIKINTEYIRLCDAMKYSGMCGTGGEAKVMIASGEVLVNGEICLLKGKKLRDKDIFAISGSEYIIIYGN